MQLEETLNADVSDMLVKTQIRIVGLIILLGIIDFNVVVVVIIIIIV